MLDSRVVLSKFQESSSYIQECRDKALNLLLGLTGSGKTTIINAILGYDLDKNSDGTVDRVDSPSKRPFQKAVKSGITETETSGEMIEVDKYNTPITKKNLPKIGHGAKSETSHPTLYHEAKKNCFLLDCAGFGDTRSNEDRVSISLAMESAFRNASNINSVFIVINYNDLISERGKSIKKLAKMMMSLFSDIEKAAKSLHFVFTHLDSVYNEIKIDNLRKCERDDIPANQIANEISIQEAVYNRLLLIINNIISALEQQTQSWSPAKLASFGRYGLGVVGSSLLNKMGYNSGEGINLSLGKESFFKDARKNARLLYFFKLIQKSLENKVALLFNVTDQQHINLFRDRLLDVINTTRGLGSAIPIQAFNFKEYDSQRTKFEHEIKDSAWKFYHLLNDINELPQEIANLEGQIGHLNLLINNYNKNLQESPDNSVNRLGQIQLVLDEQKKLITDKQDEIDLQMAKLAECKKEKDNLESDDLVSDSYHFEESRWSFLILPYFMSYSYKVFDVNERSGPISHYEITPTNGRCEVLGYVKEKGILSISYISATGEDGKCSLVVYYKKRFYSDNPQKIQSYRSEINRININIDRLNGELGKYQSKDDSLSTTHQGNR
jgi:GTPase SAR1 family protein